MLEFLGDHIEAGLGSFNVDQESSVDEPEHVQHFEAIKFLVPQVLANDSGMIEAGVFVLEVTLESDVMQSELGLERLHDDGRHVGWVGQERAEEA